MSQTTVQELHLLLGMLINQGHADLPIKLVYQPQFPKEAPLQAAVRLYAADDDQGNISTEPDVLYLVAQPGAEEHSCRLPWGYPEGII